MTVGDAGMWSDVFPGELIPRILDLVVDTWKTFPPPAPDEKEVPITRRFRGALKHAKDYNRLPLRIERETAEDDFESADQLGRIDLKFTPAAAAREEVYFAFECKRLYPLENGTRRPRTSEYVTEGMIRFITGTYSSFMQHGGVIAYVLNGDCELAIKVVEQNIANNNVLLKMSKPAGFVRSTLRPTVENIRETNHLLAPKRPFCMQHVFLPGALDGTATVGISPATRSKKCI